MCTLFKLSKVEGYSEEAHRRGFFLGVVVVVC